jgi:hypothetical protein
MKGVVGGLGDGECSLPWSFPKLLQDSDPGNLAALLRLPHTRFTYHRTWETGLETEIRVAAFSPDFFVLIIPTHPDHSPGSLRLSLCIL